jgi:hypothetical protein
MMTFVDADGVGWAVSADRVSRGDSDPMSEFGFVFTSGKGRRFLATRDVPDDLLDGPPRGSLKVTMPGRPSSGVDHERWVAMLKLSVPVD